MKYEECKEGMKVKWSFGGGEDEYGIICSKNGSIFTTSGNVWVNFSGDICNRQPSNLTPVEQTTQENTERKYSKEEIIEYMEYVGDINVKRNIRGIEEYFSEVKQAVELLTSKGYTVVKN